MSEEQVTDQTPAEEVAEAPTEGQETPKPDVAAELQELGHQLAAATKAVLESPEAQEFKTQLQRGLESLEKSVNQLVGQARETKVGQKVESGVGKVESGVSEAASTVKERRMLETLAESVATALQTVNRSLGQAVEKAEVRAEEAKAKRLPPQQIAVVGAEGEAPDEPESSEE
jgi:hypothetical protein